MLSPVTQIMSAQTVSALLSFVMLMALHPHVQRRAQAEVDERLGDELPDVDRIDNLPYVAAVLKEVLRYAPVGPLGKKTMNNVIVQALS